MPTLQSNSENEIRCPHCRERITGTALFMLGLDKDELVDSAVPCPSCGKTITKMEVAKTKRQNKRWYEFWRSP